MGEQKKDTSGIGLVAKRIAEISGYVAGIITYIAAITGRLETRYPTTVAALTLIVTAVLLWAWRWPRISARDSGVKGKSAGRSKGEGAGGFPGRLIDPLRTANRNSYVLPLSQRRIEAVLLSTLAVIAIVRSGTQAQNILGEFNPPQFPLSCDQPVEEGGLIVAIAYFYESPGHETVFRARIHDELMAQVQGEAIVCYLESVIEDRSQALEAQNVTGVKILIWGRSDADAVDVHLEVLDWEILHESIWSFPRTETGFQEIEQAHLTFLAQYGFGLLLYIDGQLPEARAVIESALREVVNQPWVEDPENKTDLADAHFLLGLIYGEDETLSEQARYEKARSHYTEAIQLDPGADDSILNRGQTCMDLQDLDCAMEDFTTLIDRKSSIAAAAYINRSYIQPTTDLSKEDLDAAVALDPSQGYSARGEARLDWDDFAGAIDDLQHAIGYTPKDPDLYHSLGKAQLLSGDCGGAVQTYKDALPYLDEGIRGYFIDDLETLSPSTGSEDCFDGTINEIVLMLKEA